MDMTDTTHSIWMDQIVGQQTGAPHIAGTAVALTAHRYNQDEVASVLTKVGGPEFARFAQTSGVDTRSLALPLSRYPELTGFTEANAAYVEVAAELGEQAVRSALQAAHVAPEEVDAIVMVSSTGVAVPTIDARLASRIGFRPDIKRIPLFGLGCVAGAASLARVHDYLRSPATWPCSCRLSCVHSHSSATTRQSLRSSGCACSAMVRPVVATGADWVPATPTANRGPTVLATRSRLFPGTVDVMGWNVSSSGFGLVMSRDVPHIADAYLGEEVNRSTA
jgi:alkylresorcinol/alkylpyrone synthase